MGAWLASVRSSRARWRAAGSFAELCELGSAFARGEIAAFPGWGASTLDEESDSISESLSRINAAGFLTVASQPGRDEARSRDGSLVRQRAFCIGFAEAELAARLLALGAPLRVTAPGATGGTGRDEPMTIVDGVTRVAAGSDASKAELRLWRPWISSRAFDELAAARYVCAFDERFGAHRELWEALERLARG